MKIIFLCFVYLVIIYICSCSWKVTNEGTFDCKKCEYSNSSSILLNENKNYTCPSNHACLGTCYGHNCQRTCSKNCLGTCDNAGMCTMTKIKINKIKEFKYTELCLGQPKQCFNVTLKSDGNYGLVIRGMLNNEQDLKAPSGVKYYNQSLSKTHSKTEHKLSLESDSFQFSGKDFSDTLTLFERQIKSFHFLLANSIKSNVRPLNLPDIEEIGFLGIGNNKLNFYLDLIKFFHDKHMANENIMVYYQPSEHSEVLFLGDIPFFLKNGQNFDKTALSHPNENTGSLEFNFSWMTTQNSTDIFLANIKISLITDSSLYYSQNKVKSNFVLILEEKYIDYFKRYYFEQAIACNHCEFVEEKVDHPSYEIKGYFKCNMNISINLFPKLGFSIEKENFVYISPEELFLIHNQEEFRFRVGFAKNINTKDVSGYMTLSYDFLKRNYIYLNYDEKTFGILTTVKNQFFNKNSTKEFMGLANNSTQISCSNKNYLLNTYGGFNFSNIIVEEQYNNIPMDDYDDDDEEISEITYEIDYIILIAAFVLTLFLSFMLCRFFRRKNNYSSLDNTESSIERI